MEDEKLSRLTAAEFWLNYDGPTDYSDERQWLEFAEAYAQAYVNDVVHGLSKYRNEQAELLHRAAELLRFPAIPADEWTKRLNDWFKDAEIEK